MRVVIASLVGLLVATPVAAQQAQPGERPREHVVRTGDTLWDLAGHYFSNPYGWRTIYEANLSVVEDPHWIYPTEVLIIPGLYDDDPAPAVAVRPMDRPLRTVFYREPVARRTGDQPTVLTEPALESVPVKPGEFHSAEFIANPDDLEVVGRMIRSARSVPLMGQDAIGTAHPKDVVFLGYASRARPDVGTRLMMLRTGRELRRTARGAHIIHPSAVVRVVAHHEDVMEAQIEVQFEPVYLDQLVVPLEFFPDFMGESAVPVEEDLEGRVVTFVSDQPLHGRTDRGFINLGARSGVAPGDVFMAYLPERRARQRNPGEYRRYIEELPPEAVAELRVLRVTEDYATFAVDALVLPLLEDGIRVRRIRRMP